MSGKDGRIFCMSIGIVFKLYIALSSSVNMSEIEPLFLVSSTNLSLLAKQLSRALRRVVWCHILSRRQDL